MFRRRLLACAFLAAALAAGPAAASGEKAAGEKGDKLVGQYVDLQPMALPVVVDGRLVNYIFVTVRLNLAANADTSRWRAKEPYFRDALVRAGYATPFTVPNEPDKIDVARVSAALMRAATGIAGPNVVRSAVVTSQKPSRRARAPRA
jgi:hypothetical protein